MYTIYNFLYLGPILGGILVDAFGFSKATSYVSAALLIYLLIYIFVGEPDLLLKFVCCINFRSKKGEPLV